MIKIARILEESRPAIHYIRTIAGWWGRENGPFSWISTLIFSYFSLLGLTKSKKGTPPTPATLKVFHWVGEAIYSHFTISIKSRYLNLASNVFSTKAKGKWATTNQICQSRTIYKEAQNKVVILDFLNWRRVALFLFHCVSKASHWALISAVHFYLGNTSCIEQSCSSVPSPHWSKVKTWTK